VNSTLKVFGKILKR